MERVEATITQRIPEILNKQIPSRYKSVCHQANSSGNSLKILSGARFNDRNLIHQQTPHKLQIHNENICKIQPIYISFSDATTQQMYTLVNII
jgi:hypothetical protein